MQPTGPELDTIAVFFVYGLSFFTMGLAVLFEASRVPVLAEARVMRPLAVFGLLHGLHEWLELFHMQWAALGQVYALLPVARIVLLTASFLSLLAYGVRVLQIPYQRKRADVVVGGALLILYAGTLVVTGHAPWQTAEIWSDYADALARYLIAIPAGLLAAMALRSQARQQPKQDRALTASLALAGGGFFLYGLSQAFAGKGNSILSPALTTDAFRNATGLPIQSLRGLLAAVVAIGLIRALHLVERKRREELITAQQERLAALEQLQRELEKRKEMRRELLRRTVLAQEEERARLARELHDETSQVLTAASLNMATLKNILPDQPLAHELIGKSQELCRAMARGLHRLVHDLRPAQLDDLGLVPSLHHLTDEARRFSNLKIKLKVNGEPQRIDPLVETVLFRITQEAITNITRHARTDRADIRIDFSEQQICLEIEDHGAGFSPDGLPLFGGGCGLAGIRERAESVGGAVLIESQPNQGTRIEVVIPMHRKNPLTYACGDATAGPPADEAPTP